MADIFKLGVAGLVHDHVWGLLNQFRVLQDVSILAAADPNPPLLKNIGENFGVSRTYREFSEMLEKEELDAVLACTENSRHVDVVEAAGEKGVHVIMEKPMSASLEQADRIVEATERHGIKVMVNYPTTWDSRIQHAHKLVEEGRIGNVFHIRFRGAHAGPKEVGCSPYFYTWLYDKDLNGAGALFDYCCYGVNIAQWFLSRQPQSVTAVAGILARTYLTVEDNALILMDFGDAIGMAAACWSQVGPHPIHGPVISGVDGSLIVDEEGNLLLYAVKEKGNYRDIHQEVVEVPPPPEGWSNGPEYFVEQITRDEEIEDPLGVKFNRNVQEVLQAGLLSATEGKRIHLPL